jgi:hypothetical protein
MHKTIAYVKMNNTALFANVPRNTEIIYSNINASVSVTVISYIVVIVIFCIIFLKTLWHTK